MDGMKQFVTSEIVRNITGYLNHGAFGYSHEQKLIVKDRVEHDVLTEMRREGKDPFNKRFAQERERRIEAKTEEAMKLRGPSRSG